jgi:predicted transcriptional regulator
MMKRLLGPVVALAVLVPGVHAGSDWGASFATTNPLEFSAAETASFTEFAVTSRSHDEALLRLRLRLVAEEFSVQEVTATWLELDAPGFPHPIMGTPVRDPMVAPRLLRNATLFFEADEPQGAAVFFAGQADVKAPPLMKSLGVVSRPALSGDPQSPDAGKSFHDHEREPWQLSGNYLRLDASNIAGTLHGPIRLYFCGETAFVSHAGGREEFAADEKQARPAAGSRLREVRWYIISADQAFGTFETFAVEEIKEDIFARSVRALNVSSVAVDSLDGNAAGFPVVEENGNASAWIRGSLGLALEAPSEGSAYGVTLWGQPEAFSVAGGDVQPFVRAGAMAALAAASFVTVLLWRLIMVPLGALFSRVARNEALDSPWRSRIVESLSAKPGQSYGELRECLTGIRTVSGLGVLTYHLLVLERLGLIRSQRFGRHRRYFRAEDFSWERHLALLRSSPEREIFQIVMTRPDVGQGELLSAVSQALSLKRPTFAYHLAKLKSAGLIVEKKIGRRRRYQAGQIALIARDSASRTGSIEMAPQQVMA